MEIARAAGLRVAAHCRSAESVLMAVRHGIEVIYHANYADERALDALEAARDRDLRRSRPRPHLQPEPGAGGVPRLAGGGIPARARGLRGSSGPHAQSAASASCRGRLRLPRHPHGTYARDLWIFVKVLGFSAMETLVAATQLGGELMGRPGELGIVKAGRPRRSAPRGWRPARRHRHPAGPGRPPHGHEGRRDLQEARRLGRDPRRATARRRRRACGIPRRSPPAEPAARRADRAKRAR